VNSPGRGLSRLFTRGIRRYLVGPDQRWIFEPPSKGWIPPRLDRTSLYLHVPFCKNCCPYCPYNKVPYDESLVEPYTKAALDEVDWWADRIGPAEITSIYIGGGTPTLALSSVASVLGRVQEKFHLTGDICIETNPLDVNDATIKMLHQINISLVSLGVQSFHDENLKKIGRTYSSSIAEKALKLLAESGFASVNADILFALPGQTAQEVNDDLIRIGHLGANQVTTYPLFTFPYSSIGKYLKLSSLRMPNLHQRYTHYRAISRWCSENGYQRVSVWGFKAGSVPRYSSVTRDGYIGIGPGAGSHLPDGFVLNTFDLNEWIQANSTHNSSIALRLPFTPEMSGWWWLYWRFYDTHIPLQHLDALLGKDAPKARRWMKILEFSGLAVRYKDFLDLTEPGSFWLHLIQNHFALSYVNRLWTEARMEAWPKSVSL